MVCNQRPIPLEKTSSNGYGLVTLATIVSISELLLARLFSDLILPSEPRSSSNLVVLSIGFSWVSLAYCAS